MAQLVERSTGADRVGRVRWTRTYPPLFWLGFAMLIAVVILPSALNLPQANPTTLLEYAPVPPTDDSPPSNETGGFSSLGLGSSSGLTTGAAPKVAKPQDRQTGKGLKPVTKRCVGKPLRQTEDRNAPPCVPYFDGDNQGETYQGVTGEEITVLLYASAYQTIPDNKERRSEETPASGSYCDVDGAPNQDVECLDSQAGLQDHAVVRVTRAYANYFNERFQTYGRHVHFWVYFTGASSPAGRRADAADNWERLKPFAVLDNAFFGGYNEVYAEAITKRRVSVYGSFAMFANSYYRDSAPFIWSFWPDVEHAVDMYTTYVCTKVAPYAVSHSGNPGENGMPRKYAFMYTTDPDFAGLTYFAQLAKLRLKNCPNGAKLDVVDEDITYTRNQYQIDSDPTAATEARDNIAKMRGDGVTTILWLGGYETQHSLAAHNAAPNAAWLPEWVVAGDLLNDAIDNGRAQSQDVWSHAWLVSNNIREDRTADSPARQAYREAESNPNANDEDDATNVYRTFFTLFKAIQVAGPELTPDTVDQGQHAIPKQASTDPFVAACFYDSGDFTCVKDAMETWWDPNAADPAGNVNLKGCYRMVRGGKRYLEGTWEGTDSDVFADPNDPCNSVTGQAFLGTP